ncbi:MAG: hypothetical protein QOK45_2871 [Mycobacterium sp.]|jgi:hypothetical protein|nr:hypothetical protein [Mycobacterium sp.]
MPLPLSVCFSDTLMRRPLAGDLGLLGGHRRGQLRDSRADVLREVLKVAALGGVDRRTAGAALPDRATRDRAANRLTGD